MAGWRKAGATVTGSSHLADGLDCQDRFAIQAYSDRLIAVVADGAGSAPRGADGATIAVETLASEFKRALLAKDALNEGWLRSLVVRAIEEARVRVMETATRFGVSSEEFHSTILGVLADPEGGVLFHIGDGAAAVVEKAGRTIISRPENGRFPNETFFYTEDDWQLNLRITPFLEPSRILLASDGAACFAFDDGYERLSEAFFAPLCRALEEAPNGDMFLGQLLARSDAVTASDDDKTIVWAAIES